MWNWVDAALLAMVALVAWGATSRGFLQVFAGLLGFVLTLAAALLFTAPLAAWLASQTAIAQPWTLPLAFVLLWAGTQLVYSAITHLLLRRSLYRASRSGLNRWLAIIPGALQGLLIGGLLLTLLALAPSPACPRRPS